MKHFRPEEFACKCGCGGGIEQMDQAFLVRLERARGLSETPFIVTSAYRCARHNRAVAGSPNSSHLRGLAVDIAVSGDRARYEILTALWGAGFSRVGIGRDFIHVDGDETKRQMVIWLYP